MEEDSEDGIDFMQDSGESVSVENIQLSFSLDMIRTIKVPHGFNIGTGGSIFSDPVVAGGTVYFGACDRNFYAVDALTGEKKWKFAANDVVSSPCLHEGRLYFGSYDYNMYCLDTDGNLLWTFPCRDKIMAKPVVHNSVVYFGSKDQNMYAVEAGSGRLRWKFRTSGRILSTAFPYKGLVMFGSGDNNLYALEEESGRLAWKFATQGPAASPLVHDDILYFGSMDHNVYAMNPADQTLLWKFRTGLPIPSINQPLVLDDSLYIGSRDYAMYKLSLGGDVLWRFRASHMIHTIPVVSGGVVYFGSDDHNLYAVDSGTGRLRWKLRTDGPVLSSPALHEGVLYFGSWDCHLYAVSTSGRLVWKCRTSSSSHSMFEVEMKMLTKPIEFSHEAGTGRRAQEDEEPPTISDYGAISTSYVGDEMRDYLGFERTGLESGIGNALKRYKGTGKKYR